MSATEQMDQELFGDDIDGSPDEQHVEGLSDDDRQAAILTNVSIGMHQGPCPTAQEMSNDHCIEGNQFALGTFKPSSRLKQHPKSSGKSLAMLEEACNTIRWRRQTSSAQTMQSNARIIKWSDGSLTLQLASDPTRQAEITSKSSAQDVSRHPDTTNPSHGTQSTANNSESFTYLAAPHENEGLMRHTNHITKFLTVQTADHLDDALLTLKRGLAVASHGNQGEREKRIGVINIHEDPENAKRRAEIAEKEKLKAQRRYNLQQERENRRANEVFRRSGALRLSDGNGLTVDDLEGGLTSSHKKSRRRNSDNSGASDSEDEADSREDFATRKDSFIASDSDGVASHADDTMGEDAMNRAPDNSADRVGRRGARRRILDEDDGEDIGLD